LAVVVEDVVRVAAVVAGNACHSKSVADALRFAVAVVEPQATIATVEAVSGIAHGLLIGIAYGLLTEIYQ